MPWVVRKLRRLPDTRGRLPDAYAYTGTRAGADQWVAALTAATENFSQPPTGASWALQTPRRVRRWRPDADEAVDVAIDSGVELGSLLDVDEFAIAILAIIGVVIVAAIAVPLGLIAIELVLAFGLAAAGVILRLAGVKPWTVLVLRHGTVVTAVAVKGWRTSGAVIAALRERSLRSP